MALRRRGKGVAPNGSFAANHAKNLARYRAPSFADTKASEPFALEDRVVQVFSDLWKIQMMDRGKEYITTVGRTQEKGTKEYFMRRRSAAEIWTSGLASGCGDYASAFLERIDAAEIEALLVEGAEVSEESLDSHFSGHSAVAIRTHAEQNVWWLVDPTDRQILSRDWRIEAKTFEAAGSVYWILFCGKQADYPIHNAEQIREFYGRALDSIPPATLSEILRRKK
ncbi:MAG: hypothetical protein QM790_16410 [Nibricoccus sp.]